ncbi:MAG: PAS domain-containing sensor histidine kinase [Bacteroidetes bacterium]|nr:PAS domain-containing sensor histidine kinase [Fibrella sp.]
MLTDQPSQLSFAQLFDTLPDAVVYFRAVPDEHGQVVDFLVEYANPNGQDYLEGNYQSTIGTAIRHNARRDPALAERTFLSLLGVINTGQSTEEEYFSPVLNEWLCVSRVKADRGVLSIIRVTTARKQLEAELQQQTDQLHDRNVLLQGILDTSLSNIFVYEAIRDETPDGQPGPIQDFHIRLVNQSASRDTLTWLGADPTGNTLLKAHPSSRQSGQFNLFCQVTETGQSIQVEHYYPIAQVWFNTSVARLNDGCVVTGVNITAQKQAVLANQRQTELLNNVLDVSNSGIIAFEAIRDASQRITDFRFLLSNRASVDLTGKTADEMVGNTLLALFPGNVESGLFDLYVHTTNTGEPGRTEVYYNHDGLDIWLDIAAQKLRDGFVVTFSDVSVMKRATRAIEQARIASERQADLLNTVLDNSQTAISLHEAIRDNNGRIIDFRAVLANKRAMTMWGALADTVMNRTFFDATTPEQQAADFPKYVRVVETGEPDLTEFNIGEEWLLRLTAKSGDGVVISNIDITQSHQLRQRLETSSAERQTIIDTSQTGIFLFTPVRDAHDNVIDFRFRMANRMLAAYVGQQPEAVVGALGSTWFPGYKTNGLFDAYHKTYTTGETQRLDFHYDADNIDVWLDIMSTKLGDEVLVTFGDYTPLKQLQQRLEASVVDLKRSNANLEQFAYVASHDLQEPLRKIQAFGDIIQSQYAPIIGDQGADMIQRMQSAAARMQMLIKDVLAYSRVATKRENVGPVDLNEVIEEVLENLETAITDKNATVTIGPMPTVVGDAPQLRQLLQNLLSNALKFSRPGVTPHIRMKSLTVRGLDTGIAILPLDAGRLFYLIELQDNGIGFAPQHAERIFQVFQRLHNRSHYAGTGIGLAIVQKVIENHQGYVAAESKPGEGATFRLLLPVES